MRHDKAMLPLYGTILLDKVLDTLRAGLQRVILVVNHHERFEGYGLKKLAVSILGCSGTGKTTLIEKVLPELVSRE